MKLDPIVKIKYIDWVTLKIAVMFVNAVIGVPAYFIMGAPNWELVLVYIIVGYITYNFAQICYHRWLCHFQFEPNWLSRKILLASTVISAVGPPGNIVFAHLNHHKYADKEGDPHSPKDLGWWRMLLGRYKTPTGAVSIRKFLRQRDAVFTTKHYWKLYSGVVIIHALINPWLVVWMAFNFIYGWFFLTYLNYFGHNGKEGEPTTINFVMNMQFWGEGYHDNHHDNESRLVQGPWDVGGKYVVPLLSK